MFTLTLPVAVRRDGNSFPPLLICLIWLFWVFRANLVAQVGTPAVLRQLATQAVTQRLAAADPTYHQRRQALEAQLAGHRLPAEREVVTIPILFHLLHPAGRPIVGEAQVRSQWQSLERDFGAPLTDARHPADTLEGFLERAADPLIRFCPVSGGPASPAGIHMVPTGRTDWRTDDAMKFDHLGGADAFLPGFVLNVWVVELADGISGYAQVPGGPAATDGIVIDHRFFGTTGTARAPYDQGKTLTHLIGNYLGLQELWGQGLCTDDGVADTPLANAPNVGCPAYRHLSTCDGHPVEMTMNFMDNTEDACMYLFTRDQVRRMHAVLREGGVRASLRQGGGFVCHEPAGPGPHDPVSPPPTEDFDLSVYPNPTSGVLHYQIRSRMGAAGELQVSPANGTVCFRQSVRWPAGEIRGEIDCTGWAAGTYFVQVSVDGRTLTRPVLVRRP